MKWKSLAIWNIVRQHRNIERHTHTHKNPTTFNFLLFSSSSIYNFHKLAFGQLTLFYSDWRFHKEFEFNWFLCIFDDFKIKNPIFFVVCIKFECEVLNLFLYCGQFQRKFNFNFSFSFHSFLNTFCGLWMNECCCCCSFVFSLIELCVSLWWKIQCHAKNYCTLIRHACRISSSNFIKYFFASTFHIVVISLSLMCLYLLIFHTHL